MAKLSRQVDITHAFGLHLRAAGKFARLACQFRADVWVAHDGHKVNGKSILDLTTLAAACGSRLHLETDGPDADAALDSLAALIDSGFDIPQPGPDTFKPPHTAHAQAPAQKTSAADGDPLTARIDEGLGSIPSRDAIDLVASRVRHMSHEPTAAAPSASPILIIEDDRDTADTMARLLNLLGHNVQVAYDGQQAIELARRHRPRYVLLDLDLGLPDLDGYQVAPRLRQECAEPLVIIAITGYGQEEDRRRSRAAGIDHHLLKPTELADLLSLLSPAQAVSHSGSAMDASQ